MKVERPAWLRIGEWVVKPNENALSNKTSQQSLEPKLMNLLLFLAQHANEVQSNEVLLQHVWGGTFYSDNPLHRSIAVLRRALGDSAANPSFIRTVRKRGYQLIAPVCLPDRAPVPLDTQARFRERCPFPGLDSFCAADAPVYFGRNNTLAALASALQQQMQAARALVLVLGPSGCGKTSLIHAGLLPLLQQSAAPLTATILAQTSWDVGTLGQRDPLQHLLEKLCEWHIAERPVFVASELSAALAACVSEITNLCVVLKRGLAQACAVAHPARAQLANAQLEQTQLSAHGMLVLVLDQIELLAQRARVDGTRLAMLDQLIAWLVNTGSVMVLMAGRSDFYQELLSCLPNCMELKRGAGHFDVPAPTAAEISQMIREPARIAGLSFERDPLTGAQLDDVLRDAALSQPEALPLLQFTLELLYERRSASGVLSFAAYEAIGRLEGALVQRAESTVLKHANSGASMAQIFQRMVELNADHHGVLARWVAWADLGGADERALVEELVQQRLLVSQCLPHSLATMPSQTSPSHLAHSHLAQFDLPRPDSTAQACFRPAHDALLRLWPRAQNWCKENQRQLKIHARLRSAARHWHSAGRRRDELLNTGRPLTDAKELMLAAPLAMQSLEREFVRCSLRVAKWREYWRRAALASLLTLTMVTSVVSLNAHRLRGEAEQRRGEAEGMVDYLLDDLAEKLRPIGRLDLLNSVASRALGQFEKNPQQFVDLAARVRRAKALRVIAESLVGQGALHEAEQALASAQSALEDGADARLNITAAANAAGELATIQFWRGSVAYQEKNLVLAQSHWLRYLTIAEALLSANPGANKWQLERAYALNSLGTLATDRRQWRDASAYFAASLKLKQALYPANFSDLNLQADIADTLSWLARVLEAQGKLREANAHYLAQIKLLSEITARAPSEGEWQYRLALARILGGRSAGNLGDATTATQNFSTAVTALQALKARDPSNLSWRYSLAYGLMQQAWLQSAQIADNHGARASLDNNSPSYSQAQAEIDSVMQGNAAPPRWRRLAGLMLLRSSASETFAAAKARFAQAEKILSLLHSETPNDTATQLALVQTQILSAQFFSDNNAPQAANRLWRQATVSLQQQTDVSDDPAALELLVRAQTGLGQIRLAAKNSARLAQMGFRHPEYLRWLSAQPLLHRTEVAANGANAAPH